LSLKGPWTDLSWCNVIVGNDKFYLSLFGSLDKQALAKGGCRASITKYFDKLKLCTTSSGLKERR
jgi:hypothetical protein